MELVDTEWDSLVIAMDGTAGSGKSTASRGVATRLGLRYLDTGAMYRAVAWRMVLDGVDVQDPDAVAARTETVQLGSGTNPEVPTITLDGIDVAREIRSDAATTAVSPVSAVPRVREILVAEQRRIIGTGGIVVEGRDIATVVAPDAEVKIYLTADPAARARRRSAEMSGDQPREVATVEADLVWRDTYDSTRAAAPLSAAPDAVALDTTHLSLEAVVERVVEIARARIAHRPGYSGPEPRFGPGAAGSVR